MTIPVLIGKFFGRLKTIEYKKFLQIFSRFRFSITIIPGPTSYIPARSFQTWHVMAFLGGFSVAVAIITGILMVYTPLNSLFFSKTIQLSHYQVEELRVLESKVRFLVKEVDGLKADNERLEKAILLGDPSLINEFSKKPKGQSQSPAPKTANNIFLGFTALMERFFPESPAAKIQFTKPCDGFVTNTFKPEEGHYGIDYSLTVGSPVYAAGNGYIIFSDYVADEGYTVIVAHHDGYITVYKHCSQITKRQRERVMQGETIALSGNSGRLTTGPHLHFEIWHDGVCMDPQTLLFEK
jgi:murein DD-endopeptidase MepM/ murein hydrolase activator NlpD